VKPFYFDSSQRLLIQHFGGVEHFNAPTCIFGTIGDGSKGKGKGKGKGERDCMHCTKYQRHLPHALTHHMVVCRVLQG